MKPVRRSRTSRAVAILPVLSLVFLPASLVFAGQDSALNQPPEGFIALFNGENLDGWKGLVGNPYSRANMSAEDLAKAQAEADEAMRAHWRVEDGILFFDGHGSHLCTVEDYGDFELLVDWKIAPGGDSGLYLRGTPQVQIWDPANTGVYSGGLYNNQKHPDKPLAEADRPVGEWNTFHIKMVGDRVTIHLNDVLVVDDTVLENYWNRGQPLFPEEQIELQAHGSPLWFRNIFLREIPRAPGRDPMEGYFQPAPTPTPDPARQAEVQRQRDQRTRTQQREPRAATGPGPWRILVAGADMAGWRQVGGGEGVWRVAEGVLSCTGEAGGWLATDQEFSDFELELEFRLPEGGNSGVFLRAPLEGNPAFAGMEVQLLDDTAEKHANLQPEQYCGSIYGVAAPSAKAAGGPGEWQSLRIRCEGRRLNVELNGETIQDLDLDAFPDRDESHPGLKREGGHIGLQNHRTPVEFRNVRVRTL